jgi:SAM-dependent methyltransferase
MTQNIYDNPDFFAGYSRLGRSVDGLDGAAEWPAIRALLPDMAGLDVVDLGCGFGWFCRWARAAGAKHVLGLDVSEKMLARARADTTDDAIEYRRADLETVALPAGACDLAYSSLTLHYIADLGRLLATVHRALRPGGHFIYSAEHPIYMAPSKPAWAEVDGRQVWPLDDYLVEGPRRTDWLAEGVIKQHRLLGTQINALIAAGFAIRHVEEWCPTDAQIAARPALAAERHRPMFYLLKARRG